MIAVFLQPLVAFNIDDWQLGDLRLMIRLLILFLKNFCSIT